MTLMKISMQPIKPEKQTGLTRLAKKIAERKHEAYGQIFTPNRASSLVKDSVGYQKKSMMKLTLSEQMIIEARNIMSKMNKMSAEAKEHAMRTLKMIEAELKANLLKSGLSEQEIKKGLSEITRKLAKVK